MITRKLTVTAKVGLHARPVALLAKLATELASEGITVRIGRSEDQLVAANSSLRMLTLKIASGEEVLIELGTDDANKAEEIFAQVAEALAAD
ncbi:MAG: HPr family phosphocarrier protein [Rhodoluna sp.]